MARLQALSDNDKADFEVPPIFTSVQRKKFLRLPVAITELVQKLQTTHAKVAFALLFGYFKAEYKFYLLHSFHQADIDFMTEQLNLEPIKSTIRVPKQTIQGYKALILDHFGFQRWSDSCKEKLYQQAVLMASKQSDPENIFKTLIEYAIQEKIEVTKYSALNTLIGQAISENEKRFVKELKIRITRSQEKLLDELIEPVKTSDDNIYQHYQFSSLRHIEQSQDPYKIKKQIEDTEFIGRIFEGVRPLFESLQLAPSIVEYRASTIRTSQSSQVLQKKKYRRYLDLLCFTAYQFFSNQDALVQKLLNCTQQAKNKAKNLYEQFVFEYKDTLLRQTQKVAKHSERHYDLGNTLLKILEDESINPIERIQQALSLLKRLKSKEPTDILEAIQTVKENHNHTFRDFKYDALEKVSRSLQSRVSGILQCLQFNPDTCCPKLFKAVEYYRDKQGEILKNAPQEFLTAEEKKVIFDKDGKFRVSLYKVLLFMAVAHGIKASTMNIKDTLQFKSLEEYLIPKMIWESDKDRLLEMAGMSQFKDIETLLKKWEKLLFKQFRKTNRHILNGANKYIKFKEKGYHLTTPPTQRTKTLKLRDFFPVEKYISIQEILTSVQTQTQYLSSFGHKNQLHRRQKPENRLFYAGIMGFGCQIGIPKMAYISTGITLNELENTTDKYFNLNNIQKANNKVLKFMISLDLSEVFVRNKGQIHTSSDGQKYSVPGDSLNANHSYKYFGTGKGSSVYSFIDERHLLFHSEVINSSEREAAWVIDGLMQNDVVKSDIHSTDTHGYTEIVFGATHLLGFSFAPRIKSLHKQQLYTFHEQSLKFYQDRGYKITPDKYIQEELIVKHWDEILRFIVTIKLRYATASQLLKRLSSYSKKNPFYRALKNFGQIFKTFFTLKFIDNTELRQAIIKQLNKMENANKFSVAVQGKKELLYQTREEQNVSTTCKRLIQNSILCWNYLYLTDIISKKDITEQNDLLDLIKQSSIVHWRHINFSGLYDFSGEMALENSQFDLPKIRAWKPDSKWAEENGF